MKKARIQMRIEPVRRRRRPRSFKRRSSEPMRTTLFVDVVVGCRCTHSLILRRTKDRANVEAIDRKSLIGEFLLQSLPLGVTNLEMSE